MTYSCFIGCDLRPTPSDHSPLALTTRCPSRVRGLKDPRWCDLMCECFLHVSSPNDFLRIRVVYRKGQQSRVAHTSTDYAIQSHFDTNQAMSETVKCTLLILHEQINYLDFADFCRSCLTHNRFITVWRLARPRRHMVACYMRTLTSILHP